MNGTIPLGRYAGVPIRAHWSVLLTVVLLTVVLAQEILPAAVPGATAAAYWLTALAATVVLIACLLGHELAHAVLAHRFGVGIKSITLWALGGMTVFTDEPRTPRTSALVAVAGPAESITVGALFWLAASLTSRAWLDGLPSTALVWLAIANLGLGVFNLLPASPLDGGRVLHAWLWHRSGDKEGATVRATTVGRFLGYLLIGLGVAELFTGATLSGVWLALIGWFIAGAATAEGSQAQVVTKLDGIDVRDVMTPGPVVAPGWWTIDAFADHVASSGVRHRVFPVQDFDGRPSGLVDLGELANRWTSADRQGRLQDAARPLGRHNTARPDEPLTDLLKRRAPRTDSGAFVVVADGALVGILTTTDIMRALELARLGHRPVHLTGPPRAGA